MQLGNQVTQQFPEENTVLLSIQQRKLLLEGYCNAYNLPFEVTQLIRYFIYDNPFKY